MYNSIIGNIYDQSIVHNKLELVSYAHPNTIKYHNELIKLRVVLNEFLGNQVTLPYTGHRWQDFDCHARCYWETYGTVLEFGLVPNGNLVGLPLGTYIDYQGVLYILTESGLILPKIYV